MVSRRRYAVRKKARRDLQQLKELAEPTLRESLPGPASQEAQMRVKSLFQAKASLKRFARCSQIR